MTARTEHLVASGTLQPDGGSREVDSDVRLIGNDDEVLVADAAHDAAHDADEIAAAAGERRPVALVCTFAHNDHVNAAPAPAPAPVRRTGVPVLPHPADEVLGKAAHAPRSPGYRVLADGEEPAVAGVRPYVPHTPGHSLGAVCLYAPAPDALFSGDTLFHGGPGATGHVCSAFDAIVASARDRLPALPAETAVRTGHGAPDSIGAEAPDRDRAEAPHLADRIARRH